MNKYIKVPDTVTAVQWDGDAETANAFIGDRINLIGGLKRAGVLKSLYLLRVMGKQ